MPTLIVTAEPGQYTVWLSLDGEIVEYLASFSSLKEAAGFCREARGQS